jgi:hypothetical protein
MQNKLIIFIGLSIFLGWIVAPGMAAAQSRGGDLGSALSRLKNNPRYDGRILGTHIVQRGGQSVYEVRVLRRDDRIILVYIDPQTGGVVGDSERSRTERSNRRNNAGQPNTRDRRPRGERRRKRR